MVLCPFGVERRQSDDDGGRARDVAAKQSGVEIDFHAAGEGARSANGIGRVIGGGDDGEPIGNGLFAKAIAHQVRQFRAKIEVGLASGEGQVQGCDTHSG
jgi:hypothetical protein